MDELREMNIFIIIFALSGIAAFSRLFRLEIFRKSLRKPWLFWVSTGCVIAALLFGVYFAYHYYQYHLHISEILKIAE